MIYFTFLAAFLLSSIAAYYSVIGLAKIFVGAFWPIVFMGSVLEFAKLVTASWLYRNWKTAPILLRSYLTAAVLILMLITSMGIFGFLAKAHIDSTLSSGENTVELKTINTQEKIAHDRLDYLLARAKDPSTASNKLDRQIQETQKELSAINKQRLPLLSEENKSLADIGPIKYVAALLYGDDESGVDKAVRLVIMIIMVVFDPLAVLLLVAANMALVETKKKVKRKKKEGWEQVWQPKSESWPPYEPSFSETKVADEEIQTDTIQVEKENVAEIDTPIPEVKYEKKTIHLGNGKFEEHIVPVESKYDDNAELAFKEKEKTK